MQTRGRPPKALEERRKQICVRLDPNLLMHLQAAAKRNGATLSDEISDRLIRSLSREKDEIHLFGGIHTHALCKLIAELFKELRDNTGHAWCRDRFTFDHAVQAVNETLGYFRPAGRRTVPSDLPVLEHVRRAGGLVDTKAVRAQARTYPFGKMAARMAVFRLETAGKLASYGDEDSEPEKERKLFTSLGLRLRGLLTSPGQAQSDLLRWGDK